VAGAVDVGGGVAVAGVVVAGVVVVGERPVVAAERFGARRAGRETRGAGSATGGSATGFATSARVVGGGGGIGEDDPRATPNAIPNPASGTSAAPTHTRRPLIGRT